jgi:hypothetical protein
MTAPSQRSRRPRVSLGSAPPRLGRGRSGEPGCWPRGPRSTTGWAAPAADRSRAVGLAAADARGRRRDRASGRPVRPIALLGGPACGRRAGGLARAAGRAGARGAGQPALCRGWPAAALAWLARHEPAALDAAAWALQAKDWIRLMLTGEVATEPTDASATLLWTSRRTAGRPDVAEAAGIDAPPPRDAGCARRRADSARSPPPAPRRSAWPARSRSTGRPRTPRRLPSWALGVTRPGQRLPQRRHRCTAG